MAETHLDALDGAEFRYSGDDWVLTGDLDVLANGETIEASARKPNRVRRKTAKMQFQLQDPPASLNPGNLGTLDGTLERRGNAIYLVIERAHTTNEYRLENMRYE